MARELRLYTINRGQMDDFVRVWREGVVPLRRRAGFTIEGAWIVEATNQFAWVVSLPDSSDWEATVEAYSQSPERKNLDPDPVSFIARMEINFVVEAL